MKSSLQLVWAVQADRSLLRGAQLKVSQGCVPQGNQFSHGSNPLLGKMSVNSFFLALF